MTYPDECPVFKVTIDGDKVPRGALCEAVDIEGIYIFGKWHPSPKGYISMRLFDAESFLGSKKSLEKTVYTVGYSGFLARIDTIEPLTPFAEDVVALVRGAK